MRPQWGTTTRPRANGDGTFLMFLFLVAATISILGIWKAAELVTQLLRALGLSV